MRDEAAAGGVKWLKVTKLAREAITLVEYTGGESSAFAKASTLRSGAAAEDGSADKEAAGQASREAGVVPGEERGQIETAWSYLPPKAVYALFLKCGIDNESADEHLALASIAFHRGLAEEARTELAAASFLDPKLNDEAQRYANLLGDLERLGLFTPGPPVK